jgi:hypothetical protein
MTTPRKNWSKQPDEILGMGWSDSVVADFVRLQAFLNTRWARYGLTPEEAGEAVLTPQEMMLVTNVQSPGRARRRLLGLPTNTPQGTFSARPENAGGTPRVRISWSKFAEFQGYQDRSHPNSGQSSGNPAPEIAPSEKRREEKKQEEERGAEAPSARAPRSFPPPPMEAVGLTTLLGRVILESVPKAKLPKTVVQVAAWAHEIDRLHRLDGWSWQDVRAVITWLPSHRGGNGFRWGEQILSAATLRKHFPRLHCAMQVNGSSQEESEKAREQLEEVFRGI